MQIRKYNIALLIIVAILIIFNIYANYGSGCRPDTVCMGPSNILIFGLYFSRIIVGALFIPLVVGIIAGLISLPICFLINKTKTERNVNISITIFSIFFILLSSWFILMQAFIVY